METAPWPGACSERRWRLRSEKAEVKRIHLIADHYEISVSAVLRMLVKREADAIRRAKR